jgi:hypothetical protein
VVESCATNGALAGAATVEARMLVSATGEIARLEVSGARDSEGIARCANGVAWPETHGRLSRVDVRFSVAADGKVTVAP